MCLIVCICVFVCLCVRLFVWDLPGVGEYDGCLFDAVAMCYIRHERWEEAPSNETEQDPKRCTET